MNATSSADELSVNKLTLSLTPDQWDLAVDALQYGADECTDPDWAQGCSDLAVLLREALAVAWPGSHGKPGS